MDIQAISTQSEFDKLYDGSYYTIIGAGGDLQEYVNSYSELLLREGIGIPSSWFTFRGCDFNFAYDLSGDNLFKDDLVFLSFPLDGLDVPRLAIFKIRMGDRWFDDIVDNCLSSYGDIEEVE